MEPKFKVGQIIKDRNGEVEILAVSPTKDVMDDWIYFCKEDNWYVAWSEENLKDCVVIK